MIFHIQKRSSLCKYIPGLKRLPYLTAVVRNYYRTAETNLRPDIYAPVKLSKNGLLDRNLVQLSDGCFKVIRVKKKSARRREEERQSTRVRRRLEGRKRTVSVYVISHPHAIEQVSLESLYGSYDPIPTCSFLAVQALTSILVDIERERGFF